KISDRQAPSVSVYCSTDCPSAVCPKGVQMISTFITSLYCSLLMRILPMFSKNGAVFQPAVNFGSVLSAEVPQGIQIDDLGRMLFSENDGKDISEHMLVFGPGELFAQSAADPHSLLMRRIEGFYVLGLHLPLDPLCAVVCFVRRQNGALDGRGFHHTSDRFAAHPNKFTDRFIALVL